MRNLVIGVMIGLLVGAGSTNAAIKGHEAFPIFTKGEWAGYIVGVRDGMILGFALGHLDPLGGKALTHCIDQQPYGHWVEVIRQYYDTHPAYRHNETMDITRRALSEACNVKFPNGF